MWYFENIIFCLENFYIRKSGDDKVNLTIEETLIRLSFTYESDASVNCRGFTIAWMCSEDYKNETDLTSVVQSHNELISKDIKENVLFHFFNYTKLGIQSVIEFTGQNFSFRNFSDIVSFEKFIFGRK